MPKTSIDMQIARDEAEQSASPKHSARMELARAMGDLRRSERSLRIICDGSRSSLSDRRKTSCDTPTD